MVAPKKRKANDGADGQDAMDVANSVRKKTIKRRRVPKQKKAAKQPLDNPIMKLPGELRNVIYDLVLIEERPILIHAPKKPRRYRPKDEPMAKPWREPSLLKVSKEIRNEASTVYYEKNHFGIYLRTSKIEEACTWLKKKHDLCVTEQGFGSFQFHVTSAQWGSILKWIALATLAYEIDPTSKYDNWGREWWQERIAGGGNFELKLKEVMLLGVKAKHRGLDYEALQIDFEEWARSTISSLKIGGYTRVGEVFS